MKKIFLFYFMESIAMKYSSEILINCLIIINEARLQMERTPNHQQSNTNHPEAQKSTIQGKISNSHLNIAAIKQISTNANAKKKQGILKLKEEISIISF